jgi:hypothetical protein
MYVYIYMYIYIYIVCVCVCVCVLCSKTTCSWRHLQAVSRCWWRHDPLRLTLYRFPPLLLFTYKQPALIFTPKQINPTPVIFFIRPLLWSTLFSAVFLHMRTATVVLWATLLAAGADVVSTVTPSTATGLFNVFWPFLALKCCLFYDLNDFSISYEYSRFTTL